MTAQCSCCSPENDQIDQGQDSNICPKCRGEGKPVGLSTLQALVKPGIEIPNDQREVYFCPNPSDSLMYFWGDGSLCIDKEDLKVRVGFKESESPRLACYCFDHTREEIEKEISKTGGSKIESSIREKVAKGVCQCHLTNPTGRCCLPDVRAIIKSIPSPS